MDERQKKLLVDYGPRFVERSGEILNSMLHLAADAQSCLSDEEWKKCSEAYLRFFDELQNVRLIVFERLDEVESS